ncbi:hypothetical protein [Kitasatospora purpeofusca]
MARHQAELFFPLLSPQALGLLVATGPPDSARRTTSPAGPGRPK